MNLGLQAFESKPISMEVEQGSSPEYVKVMFPSQMHTRQKLYSSQNREFLKDVTVVGWTFENGMPIRAYYKATGGERHADLVDGLLIENVD